MLKGRSLIEVDDFTLEELDEILLLAEKIVADPEAHMDMAKGKLMATLFYEPSTRTKFSFESAMLRLGGQVIGFSDPNASSTAKGESLADTVKTIACYTDLIVMRHPKEGAPKWGTKFSEVPIINAGDGGHQHPTQTLTDLLTIRSLKKRLTHLTVGVCGDLKFGRTTHSLVNTLSRYEHIKFVFISPEELKIPGYIKDKLKPEEYQETDNLEKVMPDLDILYMTRIQKERFFNEEEYLRLKGYYILDDEKMKSAKEDMIVMHPLPRVNEIATEVDQDERAAYFKQAKYGMYVRMALIAKLLGLEGLQ